MGWLWNIKELEGNTTCRNSDVIILIICIKNPIDIAISRNHCTSENQIEFKNYSKILKETKHNIITIRYAMKLYADIFNTPSI